MRANIALATGYSSPAKAGALAIAPIAGQGSGLRRRTAISDTPGRTGISSSTDSGFSLIEALVALAILAISTVGLVRAVEAHVDSTRGMERRAAAMWVAENRLAEVQLNDPAANTSSADQLGTKWRIATTRTATSDTAIDKVRIQVFAGAEQSPLATLDGFVEGRSR